MSGEDPFDAVLAVLRHAVNNDLVAVQAGIDVLGDDNPATAGLAARAVAHTRQLLGGRIEHPDATTAGQQRALWLLNILLAGCHDATFVTEGGQMRVAADGRIRPEVLSWAQERAEDLGGRLDHSEHGASILLPA